MYNSRPRVRLSPRFRGARVEGAGTYLTLESSKVLPLNFGANNQVQEQGTVDFDA